MTERHAAGETPADWGDEPLVCPPEMHVVDSHTEGEPTRVVLDGWPQPRGATMAERLDDMRRRADHLRQAVVREPRGHDAIVGALLTPPVNADSTAGVVFFNNGTYLGMCGHGLIGVVRTLQHLGRIAPGDTLRFDTPAGTVQAELDENGMVAVRNVTPLVHALDVVVDLPHYGRIIGDVAWAGNWFFITHADAVPVDASHLAELAQFTAAVQDAIRAQGITGADGGDIDHIEISAAPGRADADCRNYVRCSGGEYDRSPCGTGTSAKMAVLHARGLLAPGQHWRQEGIVGGLFTGWLSAETDGTLVPHIRGSAFVTADATLLFHPDDAFRFGIANPGGSAAAGHSPSREDNIRHPAAVA